MSKVYVIEQQEKVTGVYATLEAAKQAITPSKWLWAEPNDDGQSWWTNIDTEGPRAFIIEHQLQDASS